MPAGLRLLALVVYFAVGIDRGLSLSDLVQVHSLAILRLLLRCRIPQSIRIKLAISPPRSLEQARIRLP